MNNNLNISIAYLYPQSMNIYGDKGNIITLMKRCKDREINTKISEIEIKDKLELNKYDLFFAGGGQDKSQIAVSKDLQTKKEIIKEEVENKKPFLLICGTYQLFGHFFKTLDNVKIPGISILDIVTFGSKERKIGNVIAKIQHSNIQSFYHSSNLVGFENHSGNTFINKNLNTQTKPLAKIISGFGNNGKDKTEGAYYKNCFGTYLHGSLLPKNPHFADFLIQTALENKYQEKIELKTLDDSLEYKAHNFILKNRK